MSHRSTAARLRRVLTVAVLGSVLLSGCASTVTGSASPGRDVPTNVAAADLPITGAADDQADTAARDALADLNTFWAQAFPAAFGRPFQPLQGGYFSIDSDNLDDSAFPATGIGCAQSPTDPKEVAGNAHFDPDCDLIAYDRALLAELAKDYGRSLPAVVMAHEFGHAIQARAGIDASSIQLETQADCFAGAWTRWVVDGNARHVAIRGGALDDVIKGFLQLRDPVGYNPGEQDAHGTYFDRVSGFSDGYEGGVTSCRDDFGADRVYTEQSFTDESDAANQGNAPYSDTLDIIGKTLPPFWTSVFPAAFGKQFDAPTITAFDRTAPACVSGDRDLAYCDSDKTVYYDETDLTRPAYTELGDFALVTAISLPYALAARSELGLSTGDAAATRSAVCLTGWYEAQVYNHQFPDVTISPGDIDEAVEFLLAYGRDDKVFPSTDSSGFELLQQFRAGFLQGGSACDVGI